MKAFDSGVAEATYRQVIENALSAVENLPLTPAIDYLRQEWEPFARDVRKTWQGDKCGSCMTEHGAHESWCRRAETTAPQDMEA